MRDVCVCVLSHTMYGIMSCHMHRRVGLDGPTLRYYSLGLKVFDSIRSSQESFRKEWHRVLACDLLHDGFYHVACSLRDPTGLLDLLLDKVRFSFRADTLTSGPCTSYNQVPVFVFAAAASTHQAHLLCTSTLGALPRLAICGVS